MAMARRCWTSLRLFAGYLTAGLYFLVLIFQQRLRLSSASLRIAAPIAFFIWSNSFTGSLLYGLSPYLFRCLLCEDIGEMLCFRDYSAFALSAIDRLRRNRRRITLGAVTVALLILSHNGMSLLFVPIFVVYGVSNRTKEKCLFLSTYVTQERSSYHFFWIPALVDQKYINPQLFSSMYRELDFYSTYFSSRNHGVLEQISISRTACHRKSAFYDLFLVVVAVASAFSLKK